MPLRVADLLRKWNVKESKIVELDWWQEYRIDNGPLIVLTPSRHFSGRSLFNRNSTLWGSYSIIGESITIGKPLKSQRWWKTISIAQH